MNLPHKKRPRDPIEPPIQPPQPLDPPEPPEPLQLSLKPPQPLQETLEPEQTQEPLEPETRNFFDLSFSRYSSYCSLLPCQIPVEENQAYCCVNHHQLATNLSRNTIQSFQLHGGFRDADQQHKCCASLLILKSRGVETGVPTLDRNPDIFRELPWLQTQTFILPKPTPDKFCWLFYKQKPDLYHTVDTPTNLSWRSKTNQPVTYDKQIVTTASLHLRSTSTAGKALKDSQEGEWTFNHYQLNPRVSLYCLSFVKKKEKPVKLLGKEKNKIGGDKEDGSEGKDGESSGAPQNQSLSSSTKQKKTTSGGSSIIPLHHGSSIKGKHLKYDTEKAVDMKLLGSLSREDLKKICGDNFPQWISFPAFEQVKWMNKLLGKMWPFIADAATMVIKDSVEPLLEEYRPPGITSLKFSKLTLGNVAPKIEGIRVQSFKEGQITMDVDIRWGGDIQDLQVFTVARVIFQLADEIPCISAVVVALLADPKPRIDYTLKAVGGSLTAIPGLSDMIDDTVDTIVKDILQWPHRIVVPIGGIPVDTSDLELKPQGKVILTVAKATNLKNKEMIGKSDPYARVYIRPVFKYKTKTVDNNLNPVWDETFELIAEDKETQSLTIEVFDDDVGQDERLGLVKLPLSSLEAGVTKEMELNLLSSLDTLKVKDKKDRGSITLKVHYYEFNKEEQLAALEEEKKIMEERKRLKEAGVIGSTMDAVGVVGSGLGAGVGMVGTGIGAGVGLVGTGVSSGFGVVGSGLSKAGRFMGRTITGQSSKRSGTSTPVASVPENSGLKQE